MTRAQETYVSLLNTLGSDIVRDDPMQDIVDHEHELADPVFKRLLAERRQIQSTVAG